MTKTDVVIIGGGIVGCAAAYYLAQKGMQVTVFEKDPGVGLQASGRNGGGVRQQGRKAALPLAMESIKLWATLSAELGAELEYKRIGNLKVAFDEEIAQGLERETAWEQAQGLEDVRMLTAAECERLIPGIQARVVAGKFCATDGIANPMLVTPAFARAGRRLGVNFRMSTPVLGLLRQGSTVRGVKTATEEIQARVVINTAGPWAARFNAEAGCPIIIGPGRSQLLITERLRELPISCWVTLSGLGYIRPTRSGNLVLGSAGTRNDQYSRHVDGYVAAIQAERWCKTLPWLQNLAIIRGFSGITEYTPDSEPYIGPVPGAPGLFVAAGFHAEGFCPGPLVGKILAGLINGGEAEVSLKPFRPDRFAKPNDGGSTVPPVTYPLDKMLSQYLRLA
ncbi:MAG: FAD-binding oxidoreductase [Anaerolineales bacterium]|jgi:sarcosine oxidase subunit beta|nr:FAD-binding oxidoreductase [Anaerolineales bacterium]